jgi:hypothetical protein
MGLAGLLRVVRYDFSFVAMSTIDLASCFEAPSLRDFRAEASMAQRRGVAVVRSPLSNLPFIRAG